MIGKIEAWGDDFGIRIDDEIIRALGLKEGDEVEVYLTPLKSEREPKKEAKD